MKQDLLTIPQQRIIRSSLLLFEKTLRMSDRMLKEGDEVGILYHRKISLSPQRRELIQNSIAQALSDLAEFSEALGLKPSEENTQRIIMGNLNLCWESLEECRSSRLKGYGDVNPQATDLIEPMIDRLTHLALELSSLVSEGLDQNHQEVEPD